jgi:hypothetical protein
MIRKVLLFCGILAALLYVGSDILAPTRYPGYSYLNQSVSELRATGAPTRPFLLPILTLYGVLEFPFAVGVWLSAGRKRSLRITAVLVFALGLLDLSAYFFPMQVREQISQTGRTLTDTMHLIGTGLTVLLILLIIGFGARADGRWFRFYSYATILVLIAAGAWAAVAASQIEAGLPTPWLGGQGAYQHLRLHALAGGAGDCALAGEGARRHGQVPCPVRPTPTYTALTGKSAPGALFGSL